MCFACQSDSLHRISTIKSSFLIYRFHPFEKVRCNGISLFTRHSPSFFFLNIVTGNTFSGFLNMLNTGKPSGFEYFNISLNLRSACVSRCASEDRFYRARTQVEAIVMSKFHSHSYHVPAFNTIFSYFFFIVFSEVVKFNSNNPESTFLIEINLY